MVYIYKCLDCGFGWSEVDTDETICPGCKSDNIVVVKSSK